MGRVGFLRVLALTVLFTQGQSHDLLNALADTTQKNISVVVKQPLLQHVTQGAGELIAKAVYDVTRLPVTIARVLSVSGNQPVFINNKNIAGKTDKILAEFQAGLGNEDVTLSIDQLIIKYGYSVEIHETITEDGYVLRMYRVPGKGPPVFLMHGMLSSADDFVVSGPESSVVYLLANEGYDVWMGNARGNKHSRRHIELDPSDAAFWDFSWHEIGYYDLPAMIDYVLNTTSQKALKYIGHSQGTTSFFVMASERPEYNDKIALMVALSPGVYYTHAKSPFIRLASPKSEFLGLIAQALGLYEILPDNALTRIVKTIMCGSGPIAEIICYNPMLLGMGFGLTELNVTNLPVIYAHTPAGSSLKQLLHYGQLYNSGDFRQFDHGASKNLRIYGSKIPPSYPLEKIRAPVSLFYSETDWLGQPEDVDALYQRLSNAVDIYKIPHPHFNHLNFIWAIHFKTLIFNRLRKLLAAF